MSFGAVQSFGKVRLRACLVCGVRSDITSYTSAGHSIVGNDPCVVPFQLNVTCRSVLCYGRRRLIPPSSVAYGDKLLAVFFPPRGSLFNIPFVLHSKAMSGSISTRPHPSPTATPSPSKGKASIGSANYYIESASNFNPSKNILQKARPDERVAHRSLPL